MGPGGGAPTPKKTRLKQKSILQPACVKAISSAPGEKKKVRRDWGFPKERVGRGRVKPTADNERRVFFGGGVKEKSGRKAQHEKKKKEKKKKKKRKKKEKKKRKNEVHLGAGGDIVRGGGYHVRGGGGKP